MWDLVAAALSPCEIGIAECLLAGLSEKETSVRLGVTRPIVSYHLSRMYLKFDIPAESCQRVLLAIRLYEYSR